MGKDYWIKEDNCWDHREYKLVGYPEDIGGVLVKANVVIELPEWLQSKEKRYVHSTTKVETVIRYGTKRDASFLKWLLRFDHIKEDALDVEPNEKLYLEFSLLYLDDELDRNYEKINVHQQKLDDLRSVRERLNGERFMVSQKLGAMKDE